MPRCALDQSSPTAHLHHIAQTIELSYRLLDEAAGQGSGVGGQGSGEPAIDEPTDHPAQPSPTSADHAAPETQHSALKNSLARHLLALAAHCAPTAPIPLALLRRAVKDEDEAESPEQAELVNAAINRLVTIGLARYSDAGAALAVHRLVAAYAARGQDVTGAIALADAVALALRGLTYEVDQAGLPAAMTPLLPHAQHAADAADARGCAYAAPLLNNLGLHFHDIASYATASDYYERALRIDELRFGSDHPNVAIMANNLGSVAQDEGDLAAARAYYERALRIDEATYDPDHHKVAIRVNNLGMMAKGEGDLALARAYYERALRIDEARFGADHPKVAIRVNNLGSVAQDEGDLAAALVYLERALRIRKSSLAPSTHALK